MIETESTENRTDAWAPAWILAVWLGQATAERATVELAAMGCLGLGGSELLGKLECAREESKARTYQPNLPALLGVVCGFEHDRCLRAVASAKAEGLIEGGPRSN